MACYKYFLTWNHIDSFISHRNETRREKQIKKNAGSNLETPELFFSVEEMRKSKVCLIKFIIALINNCVILIWQVSVDLFLHEEREEAFHGQLCLFGPGIPAQAAPVPQVQAFWHQQILKCIIGRSNVQKA